ncbi:hypothetical protein [Alkalibacillus silvisoli]|uniref:Holin-like toxin n=1 Tax=Alkalibacillus silvisoli TaxID=392823 RepID=A0ABN1AAR1_9BACI
MEVKTIVYEAFGVVLANPDVMILIASFTIVLTVLITIVDLFDNNRRV